MKSQTNDNSDFNLLENGGFSDSQLHWKAKSNKFKHDVIKTVSTFMYMLQVILEFVKWWRVYLDGGCCFTKCN